MENLIGNQANLVLKWDGNATGIKFCVKLTILLVYAHAFHRRELLDVQHVLGVDRFGIGRERWRLSGRLDSFPVECKARMHFDLVGAVFAAAQSLFGILFQQLKEN